MGDIDLLKIDLGNFEREFQHELVYLKEYFEFNDSQLNDRKRNLDKLLKIDIDENPTNESSLKEMYYFDFIKIPSYFYHSSIVSLYSLLENKLNVLCVKIQNSTEHVVGPNDLVGSNILQKSRNFLIKFADIEFSEVDKEWIKITDFQKLRNLIVHQNSEILDKDNENNDMIIRIINKFEGIDFHNHEKRFYITSISLLYEFLSLIELFINKLISQISEREFSRFQKVRRIGLYNEFDLPF